jgi:hypothetical protein
VLAQLEDRYDSTVVKKQAVLLRIKTKFNTMNYRNLLSKTPPLISVALVDEFVSDRVRAIMCLASHWLMGACSSTSSCLWSSARRSLMSSHVTMAW